MRMRRLSAAAAFTALTLLTAAPALAHPHVWVKASAEVVYAPDGKVTGVKHRWSFDEAYSSFATQGLGTGGKPPTRAELADLAKVNTESLVDFDYFTVAKVDGKKQLFAEPKDYWLDLENGVLTLNFTLPLTAPAKPSRAMGLEIYDPTYFVSFSFVEGDAVKAGPGCSVTVTRPKTPETMPSQNLSESFFSSLSPNADFGLQFANRAVIACP